MAIGTTRSSRLWLKGLPIARESTGPGGYRRRLPKTTDWKTTAWSPAAVDALSNPHLRTDPSRSAPSLFGQGWSVGERHRGELTGIDRWFLCEIEARRAAIGGRARPSGTLESVLDSDAAPAYEDGVGLSGDAELASCCEASVRRRFVTPGWKPPVDSSACSSGPWTPAPAEFPAAATPYLYSTYGA